MWYRSKLIIKQNENFYNQRDEKGNLFVHKRKDNLENKMDKTEYIYGGLLGSVFKSFESKEPKFDEVRLICDIAFKPFTVYKRGFIFNRKYEINWISSKLDSMEDIRKFEKTLLTLI